MTVTTMKTLAMAAAVLWTSVAVTAAEKPKAAPVAVYVVEPTAEFQDAALRERHQAWANLQRVLLKKNHKDVVRLVMAPEDAVVVVEVLSIERGLSGATHVEKRAFAAPEAVANKSLTLTLKLTFGTYSTEIVGTSVEKDIGFACCEASVVYAAGITSNGIENWISMNRAKLPQ
jgi:hypothetical protein